MDTRSTTLGILGTGRMALRLARLFGQAGHAVVLGSRTPERARHLAAGLGLPRVRGAGYAEAAGAPVVLPAIFHRDGLLDTLAGLRPRLAGKLLVDIANPFNATYDDFILPWDDSAAEALARALPEARVVGAFKNVWWEVFDAPVFGDGLLSDVYVVGDDEAAKREFLALVRGTPFRYVDAGRLRNARIVERMTLFSGELSQRLGYFPRSNWRLLGEAWEPGARDTLAALGARAPAGPARAGAPA